MTPSGSVTAAAFVAIVAITAGVSTASAQDTVVPGFVSADRGGVVRLAGLQAMDMPIRSRKWRNGAPWRPDI